MNFLDLPTPILMALVVGAIGALVLAWATGRARGAATLAQLDRERAELAARLAVAEESARHAHNDSRELRMQHDIEAKGRAAAEAIAQRVPELESAVERERGEAQRLATENATLRATLDEERRRGEEKAALLDRAETRLVDTFKALSGDALRLNQEQFLTAARAQNEAVREQQHVEQTRRHEAIQNLVTPVREALERFEGRVGEIERARVDAYAGLREQLRLLGEANDNLRSQTQALAQSLRSPVARGRWGEVQLKRVVELAGMLAHCDFVEQAQTADGARPDLIVRLPGKRTIVVDAKSPLEAYLRAAEAGDDDARRALLDQHAADMRGHMKRLGAKDYWNQFAEAPEFVIMFLPGEAFYAAALQADPMLIERGVEHRVVPATPTTLIALLRAVEYGWRQEAVAANAREISESARELYNRVNKMAEHVAALGKSLNQSVERYNQFVGSLEGRVLPQARRFKELGAGSAAEIEALQQLDAAARAPSATELLPPPDEKSRN
jgi:DNA recombination protein RmuC